MRNVPQEYRTVRRPFLSTCPTKWNAILHLATLNTLAVAQPVYELLSAHIHFLSDRSQAELWALMTIAGLSCFFPLVIGLVEIAVRTCSRVACEVLHQLVVFFYFLLLGLLILNSQLWISCLVALVLSLCVAVAATAAYSRWHAVRQLLNVASVSILVCPALLSWQFAASQRAIGATAEKTGDWNPVPVVMVVFDEFSGTTFLDSHRAIDSNRFPNFAQLSRNATWYRNAASNHQQTILALPSLLTGRYRHYAYDMVRERFQQNLFTVLRYSGGYEVAAFEPVSYLSRDVNSMSAKSAQFEQNETNLFAKTLGLVYLYQIVPRDFREFIPEVPSAWFGWSLERHEIDSTRTRGSFRYVDDVHRSEQFDHFLRCFDQTPHPTLYFGHFLLPHMPWIYLPDGARYRIDLEQSDRCLADQNQVDEFVTSQYHQRYLMQSMYVDTLVGKLVQRLRDVGLYDRCLLVITADHGISFHPQQRYRGVERLNADEICSVPLFIKWPGQSVGEIDDRLVEAVDLFPTLADYLGLKLSCPVDGSSIRSTDSSKSRFRSYGSSTFTEYDQASLYNPATTARFEQRFPMTEDPYSLFRIGPCPELVGKSVHQLEIDTDIRSPIHVDRDPLLAIREDNTITDSPPVARCEFRGTLITQPNDPHPLRIAIAINGVIGAVVPTGPPENGVVRWRAMTPHGLFRTKNDTSQDTVSYYLVKDSPTRLVPCRVE